MVSTHNVHKPAPKTLASREDGFARNCRFLALDLGGAGLDKLWVWYRRCLVKPAPTN